MEFLHYAPHGTRVAHVAGAAGIKPGTQQVIFRIRDRTLRRHGTGALFSPSRRIPGRVLMGGYRRATRRRVSADVTPRLAVDAGREPGSF